MKFRNLESSSKSQPTSHVSPLLLHLKSPSPFFESGLVSVFLALSAHDLKVLLQLDCEVGH